VRGALLAVPALGLALAACGGSDTVAGPAPAAPDRIRVTSPAFEAGATIPRRYTCSGENVSPPLSWRGVPPDAGELAVVVEDPDAPGGTFVHWTLYGVPPDEPALREGAVPPGAREGTTSSGDTGYTGPCPPKGDEPHRYEFLVYALSSRLGLARGAAPDEVRAAIADKALARGRLVGRFGR
jgi:Raf kinase inhibitor-like YbhB/YbcL family protein